jgi:hypothetical protein
MMTYVPGKPWDEAKSDGDKERRIYLPQGTASRATKLFVDNDWAALEREFEDHGEPLAPGL